MVENKYDRFFESVKNFVLETRLAFPEDIKGLSEVNIDKLELKFNVTLPESLRSYYTFMGETCNTICTDDYLNFTERKLQLAREGAKYYNIYEGIKNTIENYRHNNLKPKQQILLSDIMNLDDILFIEYIAHHSVLNFIDCSKENPWLHILYVHGASEDESEEYRYEYRSGNLSFIGDFRSVLFSALQIKFFNKEDFSDKEQLEVFNRINIEKISWFQSYVEHRKKYSYFNVGNGRKYIEMRNEFSLEMDILSEETGIVMTIDEFEWAFIEHLRGLGVDI